mgnify:FL=1
MKRLVLILVLAFSFVFVTTESNAQKILDGPYIKENTPTRRVVPYTPIREADVMWARRVWRVIDLREKINHPLYYPTEPLAERKSLFDVIKEGITEGTLTAYDDEEFLVALTKAQVTVKLGDSIQIYVEDPEDPTGDLIPETTYQELTPDRIKQYYIKEDWFFDRERSVMDVRIMGLMPIKEAIDQDGNFKGYASTFWVYFPEARYVFANYDVFNRHNDAERRTFEDIFWKRMFNSYIKRWSNVYNNRIIDSYKRGLDALLEGEDIKEQIMFVEHDLWSF